MIIAAVVVLLCAIAVLTVMFLRERTRNRDLLQRHQALRAHFDLYETIAHSLRISWR